MARNPELKSPGDHQAESYELPYHWLPSVDRDSNRVRMGVFLNWAVEYLVYMNHIAELIRDLPTHPMELLDVGCGDGRLAQMLQGRYDTYTGVDLDARSIRWARAMMPELEWACVAVQEIQRQYDIVVAVEVLEHVPDGDITSFVRAIGNRVAPGGNLVVSVPSDARPVSRSHHRHYTSELLQDHLALLDGDWELARLDYVFAKTRVYEGLRRLLANRWWCVHSPRLWKYAWGNLRWATPENGTHLIALLQRA